MNSYEVNHNITNFESKKYSKIWFVQTAVKKHHNLQVIYTTPVLQLVSCEVQSSIFVINKYFIKAF